MISAISILLSLTLWFEPVVTAVAGIWLCFLAQWKIVVFGTVANVLSSVLLVFAAIPGLLFVRIGANCEKKGRPLLGLIIGLAYLLYMNILGGFWCIYIFRFFFGDIANVLKLPIYLWCYSVSSSPWKLIPAEALETNVGTSLQSLSIIAVTAVRVTSIVLLIAHLFWNPTIQDTYCISGLIMSFSFIIQLICASGLVPQKAISKGEDILEAEIVDEDKSHAGNKLGMKSMQSSLANSLPRVWFGFVLLAIYHSNENLMACIFFYHSLYRIHKVLQDATNLNYPLKPLKLILMTVLLRFGGVMVAAVGIALFSYNKNYLLLTAVLIVVACGLSIVSCYWEFRWSKELTKYINNQLAKKEQVTAWLHIVGNLIAIFITLISPFVGYLIAFANLFYLNKKLKTVLAAQPISTEVTPALSKVD